jgi:glycosyltransferase involved in cell wall biosynthesis
VKDSVIKFVRKITSPFVFTKRLPKEFDRAKIYVTTISDIRLIAPGMERSAGDLFTVANKYVNKDDVVWDIGSNLGILSFCSAVKVTKSGHVYSLEADPRYADIQSRTLKKFTNEAGKVIILCTENAACVVTSEKDTTRLFTKAHSRAKKLAHFSHVFFSNTQIERFKPKNNLRADDDPLLIFAGGNIIGSKGIAIALLGLRKAKDIGVLFRYIIASRGPECERLKKLTKKLTLTNEVTFTDPLSGERYIEQLQKSHIFLLPSFQKNSGLTMQEAMLAGCVPIVANCSAPGNAVNDECGFRMPVTTANQMAEYIASVLKHLQDDRKQIINYSINSIKLASTYNNENYRSMLKHTYMSVIRPGSVECYAKSDRTI